ncbi:MAG: DUF3821 domain-containing protein, partial [Methanomicrobiales archaeon]|nr:DUF3821 domain-containing protein [Methanomicrobiales archaeon]
MVKPFSALVEQVKPARMDVTMYEHERRNYMTKRLILAAIPLLAIMMLVLPVSAACTAAFTTVPTPATGNAPLAVTFTDTTVCDVGDSVATATFSYGDATAPLTFTAPVVLPMVIPAHTYTTAGTFTATLSVTNAAGIIGTTTATAAITPVNGKIVAPSNTVFIGEQGLNIAGAATATQIAWFASGASPLTDAPSKIITPDKTNFYVSPSDFSLYTGAWYNWAGASPAGAVAFYVQQASLDIKIWNADTN